MNAQTKITHAETVKLNAADIAQQRHNMYQQMLDLADSADRRGDTARAAELRREADEYAATRMGM